MAFDMSRVALGFAGGALSGYDAMLKAKMQEEYQQKREEAMYNRQKNLMEQQAKINQAWETNPNNPDTQVKKQNILASQASIKHQDRIFALQEKEYQTNTQFKVAIEGRTLNLQISFSYLSLPFFKKMFVFLSPIWLRTFFLGIS